MTEPRTRPVGLDSAGVTLVELMVVLVIIATAFMTLTAVQTSSSRDVTATEQHSRALGLAQAQMEVARAAGFASAQSDSGAVDIFNWTTNVDSAGVGINQVRVTVAWSERGTPRTLQLNNLLSTR